MQGQVRVPALDVVFSVEGVFDPAAAAQFRATLAELRPDASVVLDLRRAWEVSDLALWVLLAAPRHPGLVLRGLTRHQERMVRYLALDGSVVEPREREDPEPGAAAADA